MVGARVANAGLPAYNVVLQRQTHLEAVFNSNAARQQMAPNEFFNRLLLGKDGGGNFNAVPEEVRRILPVYSGLAFAVGANGKRLGKSVESQCKFQGSMKTVIQRFSREEASLVDYLILANQGFARDGTPRIQFFNAKTGKQIVSPEEMVAADEVIRKVNGKARCFKIKSRKGGVFKRVGDEQTSSHIHNAASLGLAVRGLGLDCFGYGVRRDVVFGYGPSRRFGVFTLAPARATGVAILAGSSPLGGGAAEKTARTEATVGDERVIRVPAGVDSDAIMAQAQKSITELAGGASAAVLDPLSVLIELVHYLAGASAVGQTSQSRHIIK